MKILDYTCPVCKTKETFYLSNWELFGMFNNDFLEENECNFLKWYMNLYEIKPILEPSKFIAINHIGHVYIPFTRVCIDCERYYNDDFVVKDKIIDDKNSKENYMIDYSKYSKNHPGDLYIYIKPYYFVRDISNDYNGENCSLKVIKWENYTKYMEIIDYNA